MSLLQGQVPEHYLVREVLHCCQGIDGGKYVWYKNSQEPESADGFVCTSTAAISPAQRQLISRITELGWLLRKAKSLCEKASSTGSPVHEALVAATNKEVNNCYRLIAILESQAQQGDKSGDRSDTAEKLGGLKHDLSVTSFSNDPSVKGQLSLRRLEVWLSEPQQRLRVVTSCLETALPLRGGHVINALHTMSKHGDIIVRRSIKPLLEEACVPYFICILRWITEGTLDGQTTDFMIKDQDLGSGGAPISIASQWRFGHKLEASMQPNFISQEFAQDILTAGRNVAFLRKVCGDSEWAAAISKIPHVSMDISKGDVRDRLHLMKEAVKEVQSSVGSRVVEIVMQKERLVSHLEAIKRFLLLDQGDFVCALLDSSSEELNKSAREVSSFSLQGHVEVALRSCAVNYDHDVLSRVQVRLGRALEGDKGWDVFNLNYVVDGPSAAVLSPEALSAYGQAFRLLWTIRRVDYAIGEVWHELNNTQHALNTLQRLQKEYGIDVSSTLNNVPSLLRFLHSRRIDMARFVSTLGARLVFKVIEPTWASMLTKIQNATDLDGIICAHEEALVKILNGTYSDVPSCFALKTAGSNSGSTAAYDSISQGSKGGKELRAALKAVLDICGPVFRLSRAIQSSVEEQESFLKRVKESEVGGEWSHDALCSPAEVPAELFSEIRTAVWRVHSSFDRNLRTFLSVIPPHSHLDLRSLALQVEGVEQMF